MEQAETLPRTARVSSARRWRLLIEYVALFVALPVAYMLDRVPVPPFPALWLIAIVCLVVLWRDPGFERSRLWNARELRSRVGRALIPFLLAAPPLLLFTVLYDPPRLFGFISQRPRLWALVMVLYPLLSVYPQGLVYRVFVFHRYRDLFPSRWGRIVASAFAFSAVHVIFENWIAPLLTLAGGLLFAWTYDRTRSSLVVGIQHAAFGCYLFTIGLGWYFYHGAVR